MEKHQELKNTELEVGMKVAIPQYVAMAWQMYYDHPIWNYHTDTTYAVPVCPHCGESFFPSEEDIGKTFTCAFCMNRVTLSDVPWVRKYIEDNTGSKEETVECSNCGNMTMKIVKRKTNGEWRTAGGQCECGFKFIV